MHRAREKRTQRDVFAYEIGHRAEASTRLSLICWKCESAVVSVAGYTKRNGSTYRPQFRLAPSTDHEAGCPLNPITVITGIAHGAHGLAQVDDDGILRLTLPKDLTDAPPPPPPADDAEPGAITTRDITTVRPLLPPLINSAAKIARFLQLHDFDPDIVGRFHVQPHGRKRPIGWGEFCYGPTPATYATLYELRRTQTPITHPIALYGTVQRIAHEGKSGRPYAVPAADVPSGTERFEVLLRSAFDTLINPLEAGTHVLAVGDWDIFGKSRTPQLRLFATDYWQVAYWRADEQTGKITEPSCPQPVTARQRVILQTEERKRRMKATQDGKPPVVSWTPSPAVAPPQTSSTTPPSSSSEPPAIEPTARQQPLPTEPEIEASTNVPAPAVPPRPSHPPRPKTPLPPVDRRRR
ncbi:hypothetical protein ACWFRK_11910 [Streptomyces sp. NPDC055157]